MSITGVLEKMSLSKKGTYLTKEHSSGTPCIFSKSVMSISCKLWTTQNSRFTPFYMFSERMLIFKFFLCCQGREGQEKIKQIFWSAILMIVPDKNPDKTETKYFESWWSTTQPIITAY